MKKALLVLLTLILAGCATPLDKLHERIRQGQLAEHYPMYEGQTFGDGEVYYVFRRKDGTRYLEDRHGRTFEIPFRNPNH